MFGYWLKKRLFPIIVCYVLICTIIGLIFVYPNLNNVSNNLLKTSVYTESDMDFDIPAPTKEQLQQISMLDFVDSVFGYYFTVGSIDVNGEIYDTKLLFSDCMDNACITMYNDNRIILECEENYDNPIYVDFDFVQRTNSEIGDEVKYSGIVFNIAAIYETNSYNGAVLIPLVNEQKDLVESHVSCYSGAFIAVNDFPSAENYFRTYKPEGRLKTRDDFNSDEEYIIHFEAWNNSNYSNEITSFSEKMNDISLSSTVPDVIIASVFIVFGIISSVVLFFRKSERMYFKQKKSKTGITGYYLGSSIFEALLSFAIFVVILYCSTKFINLYIPMDYIFKTAYMLTSISFGSAIVNFFVSIILLKTMTKS